MQSVTASLPVTELELAGHVSQINAPLPILYVPTLHTVHSTPSTEAVCPALQVQLVINGLPLSELVLAGQAVQFPTPVTTLYVPTSHALHAVPSAPT
jgi:hypothetical protein